MWRSRCRRRRRCLSSLIIHEKRDVNVSTLNQRFIVITTTNDTTTTTTTTTTNNNNNNNNNNNKRLELKRQFQGFKVKQFNIVLDVLGDTVKTLRAQSNRFKKQAGATEDAESRPLW